MNSNPRYGALSIRLHWLMLALVAMTYAFIELRVFFERGTPTRDFMRYAHFSCGLLVLGLTLLRIAGRLTGGTPPISPPPPAWQAWAARGTHLMLYAFMLGMPIVGWWMLSLRGDEIVFFGFELPPLAEENKEFGKQLRQWHGYAGRAVYALIALHAAAAIYHHKVLRDDTLRRILPARLAG